MDNLYADVSPAVREKLHSLGATLSGLQSVLVAFSGGVDSTLLLRVALDVLDGHVLAVTAHSPLHTAAEIAAAEELAGLLGASHRLIELNQLQDERLVSNPPERCYLCKRQIFGRLVSIAKQEGLQAVVDGSNADDMGSHRPGLRALHELGVRSPLAEAGLTKEDVRALSRELGLPTWDRPARPCLATRFPYGEQLSSGKLRRVEQAETFLSSLGFRDFRVRSHGTLARIEVDLQQASVLLDQAPSLVDRLEALGFAYVTMDLKGLRSGSMDEALAREGDQ